MFFFFFFFNGENGEVGYECLMEDTLGGLSDTF